MVAFRIAKINELGEIEKIARATWPDTFGDIMAKAQIDYMLDLIYNEASLRTQILNKKHTFILALKEKEPIGYTSYELNYKQEPQLMIHKLYLLPSAQGLGIGKRMIEFLSGIALENNNRKIRLHVYFDNAAAIGFYEKHGFIKVGIEKTDIGKGYIILDDVMEKTLR